MTIQMALRYVASTMLCTAMLTFSLACNKESRPTDVPKDAQELRVTFPNSQLDAVLVRQDSGGAAEGWEYYVYIVAKGKPVLANAHPTFYAGTLRGEKVLWAQAHLLAIQYDVANILGISGGFRRYKMWGARGSARVSFDATVLRSASGRAISP